MITEGVMVMVAAIRKFRAERRVEGRVESKCMKVL